jgi:hypothetical protein
LPHLFTLNNLSELVICPRLKNVDGAQSVDDVGNLEIMEATIIEQFIELPPGKRLQKTMERSTMLFMGKLTKSMAIFNSYVKLPEGTILETHWDVAIFLYF